jgi:hypothetical protein
MSEQRDPLRLFERLDVDPALRSALRRVSEAEPDAQQLADLMARVSGALLPDSVASQIPGSALPTSAEIAARPLWLKLSAWFVAGGAALWFGALALPKRSPELPPTATSVSSSGAPVETLLAPLPTRFHLEAAAAPDAAREASEPAVADMRAKGRAPAAETVLRADAASSHKASARASAPSVVQRDNRSAPQAGAQGARASAVRPRPLARAAPLSRTPPPAEMAPEQAPRALPASAVESEAALIAEAQRALRSAPARALQLLERLAARYPAGQFVEEREVLSIDALSQLALPKALAQRAQRFLSAFPASLHRARVQALLDAARAVESRAP